MRIPTLLAFVALAACSKPPPPAAPAPEPPKEEAPPPKEPEPPPPPKCESLAEKCAATDATRLVIGKASVKPPVGWIHAREATTSIAVAPANDGFLELGVATGEDPDAALAAVQALLTKQGVTDVKAPLLKARLKKPQSTVLAGDVTVKLWEVDRDSHGGVDPKKDGKPGAALVAIARVGSTVVVALGYVPKTAPPANVAAMMETLKSLRGEP